MTVSYVHFKYFFCVEMLNYVYGGLVAALTYGGLLLVKINDSTRILISILAGLTIVMAFREQREGFLDPNYEYIDLGCWKDTWDRHLTGSNQGRPHTKETCGEKAKALGHKYFSVQDGNECYTGNDQYDRYGRAEGDCPPGGGPWKAHTWEIALRRVPPPMPPPPQSCPVTECPPPPPPTVCPVPPPCPPPPPPPACPPIPPPLPCPAIPACPPPPICPPIAPCPPIKPCPPPNTCPPPPHCPVCQVNTGLNTNRITQIYTDDSDMCDHMHGTLDDSELCSF